MVREFNGELIANPDIKIKIRKRRPTKAGGLVFLAEQWYAPNRNERYYKGLIWIEERYIFNYDNQQKQYYDDIRHSRSNN